MSNLMDDQSHRFKQPRGMGAAWVRHKIRNWHAGQASLCYSRDAVEGYLKHRAIAKRRRTGR